MMFTCVFLRQDSNFIIINYVFEHIFKFQEQIDILFIHKYILWCFLLLHVCFLQFPFFLLSFSLIMIFFTLFYNFDYFNIKSNDSIWTNPNVIRLVLFGSDVYFFRSPNEPKPIKFDFGLDPNFLQTQTNQTYGYPYYILWKLQALLLRAWTPKGGNK